MSKDLTKEYKEAVMNDLPDLWGRIEAAIDAQENEKNKEIIKESVKEENKTETVKNESNIKLVSNETVSETVKTKKKVRIPAWVWGAIPFAAILLIIILPLSFFGLLNAGSKNFKNASTAPMSMTDSVAEYEAPTAASDSAAVMESADYAYEDAEIIGYEENGSTMNLIGKTNDASGDVPTFANPDYYDFDELENMTKNQGSSDTASEASASETKRDLRENEFLVNEDIRVRFEEFYEDEHGMMAGLYIIEVKSDTINPYPSFPGLNAGECIKACVDDYEYVLNREYDVSLYFVDDEINEFWTIYHID